MAAFGKPPVYITAQSISTQSMALTTSSGVAVELDNSALIENSDPEKAVTIDNLEEKIKEVVNMSEVLTATGVSLSGGVSFGTLVPNKIVGVDSTGGLVTTEINTTLLTQLVGSDSDITSDNTVFRGTKSVQKQIDGKEGATSYSGSEDKILIVASDGEPTPSSIANANIQTLIDEFDNKLNTADLATEGDTAGLALKTYVDTEVASVDTKADNNTTAITNLTSSVDDNTTAISANETSITNLTATVTDNTTAISANETAITNLTATVDNKLNTADLATEGDTAGLALKTYVDTEVASVDTKADNNTTAITNLTSSVDDNTTAISANETAITNLTATVTANTTAISANETAIANLTTTVDDNTNAISANNIATQAALATLTSDLAGVQATTGSIDLSPYATTAQINALLDGAPAGLDTLNELAAALGSDANYADTIVSQMAEKAPKANPTFTGTVSAAAAAFTGNVTGITKAMVGLGNVNDTTDANKPISIDTQAALDALDAKFGTDALTTTATTVMASINELHTEIGDINTLNVGTDGTVVSAINDLYAESQNIQSENINWITNETTAELPLANLKQGMFTHVNANATTGTPAAAYYADDGVWVELTNKSDFDALKNSLMTEEEAAYAAAWTTWSADNPGASEAQFQAVQQADYTSNFNTWASSAPVDANSEEDYVAYMKAQGTPVQNFGVKPPEIPASEIYATKAALKELKDSLRTEEQVAYDTEFSEYKDSIQATYDAAFEQYKSDTGNSDAGVEVFQAAMDDGSYTPPGGAVVNPATVTETTFEAAKEAEYTVKYEAWLADNGHSDPTVPGVPSKEEFEASVASDYEAAFEAYKASDASLANATKDEFQQAMDTGAYTVVTLEPPITQIVKPEPVDLSKYALKTIVPDKTIVSAHENILNTTMKTVDLSSVTTASTTFESGVLKFPGNAGNVYVETSKLEPLGIKIIEGAGLSATVYPISAAIKVKRVGGGNKTHTHYEFRYNRSVAAGTSAYSETTETSSADYNVSQPGGYIEVLDGGSVNQNFSQPWIYENVSVANKGEFDFFMKNINSDYYFTVSTFPAFPQFPGFDGNVEGKRVVINTRIYDSNFNLITKSSSANSFLPESGVSKVKNSSYGIHFSTTVEPRDFIMFHTKEEAEVSSIQLTQGDFVSDLRTGQIEDLLGSLKPAEFLGKLVIPKQLHSGVLSLNENGEVTTIGRKMFGAPPRLVLPLSELRGSNEVDGPVAPLADLGNVGEYGLTLDGGVVKSRIPGDINQGKKGVWYIMGSTLEEYGISPDSSEFSIVWDMEVIHGRDQYVYLSYNASSSYLNNVGPGEGVGPQGSQPGYDPSWRSKVDSGTPDGMHNSNTRNPAEAIPSSVSDLFGSGTNWIHSVTFKNLGDGNYDIIQRVYDGNKTLQATFTTESRTGAKIMPIYDGTRDVFFACYTQTKYEMTQVEIIQGSDISEFKTPAPDTGLTAVEFIEKLNIKNPVSGDLLTFDGSKWVASEPAPAKTTIRIPLLTTQDAWTHWQTDIPTDLHDMVKIVFFGTSFAPGMGTDYSTPLRPVFHNNLGSMGAASFGVKWSDIPALAATQPFRVCSKLYVMSLTTDLSGAYWVTAFDVDSTTTANVTGSGFKYRMKHTSIGNYSTENDNSLYIETFEGSTNILKNSADFIIYQILEYNPNTKKVTESWFDETKSLMRRFTSKELGEPSGEYFMTMYMPGAPGVNLMESFGANLSESECLALLGGGDPLDPVSMATWEQVFPEFEPPKPYVHSDYKTAIMDAAGGAAPAAVGGGGGGGGGDVVRVPNWSANFLINNMVDSIGKIRLGMGNPGLWSDEFKDQIIPITWSSKSIMGKWRKGNYTMDENQFWQPGDTFDDLKMTGDFSSATNTSGFTSVAYEEGNFDLGSESSDFLYFNHALHNMQGSHHEMDIYVVFHLTTAALQGITNVEIEKGNVNFRFTHYEWNYGNNIDPSYKHAPFIFKGTASQDDQATYIEWRVNGVVKCSLPVNGWEHINHGRPSIVAMRMKDTSNGYQMDSVAFFGGGWEDNSMADNQPHVNTSTMGTTDFISAEDMATFLTGTDHTVRFCWISETPGRFQPQGLLGFTAAVKGLGP